jgi:hypothetical protein
MLGGQGAAVSPGGVSKLRRRLDGESTLLYGSRADPRCVIEQHWANLCWARAPIARWSPGLLVLDPTVPGGLRRAGLRDGEGS